VAPAPGDTGIAFAGAVLTGGRSSRMGRDKATLTIDGMPMAARVAEALRLAGAEPVLAVGGNQAALEALGLAWVADRYPGEGPLGGILSAFAAAGHEAVVAVVATDLPALEASVVQALVAALGTRDVAVAGGERPEPLCAVWRVSTCEAVLTGAFEQGERAVHRAWAALDQIVVPVPARHLRNVNHPDDLGR
jgi:molybdopterin-guanine dinucleotide biosynthesis protein A